MKKLIVGNWKMNGSRDDARALIADIVNKVDGDDALFKTCKVVVCPPLVHLGDVRHALYGFPKIKFGAQDCSAYENGAHTGDISAQMLKDAACSYIILGHSERRQYNGETDSQVAAKAEQALKNDIVPIICIGETDEERKSGKAEAVVGAQLKGSFPKMGQFDNIVVAYEPVWAIGTGNVASAADAENMHAFIRAQLKGLVADPSKVRILYGGSMKPDNAKELLAQPNIDGGLIGGASLMADDFIAIARAV